MAKSRLAAPARQRGRAPTYKYSKHVISILSQRDDLMTEIGILRGRARALHPLTNKADALLTRHWSRADWQSREEILRAARWLLNLARIQPLTT